MGHKAPTLTDVYAPIRDDLAIAQQVFNDELKSEIEFVNALVQRVAGYRGKMLRPALLLLSARATGTLRDIHHKLAAVVEIVHMATLVHDDVLDEADERRGQPTVCSTDGNVTAVLLGDFLISHAYHLCSSTGCAHAGHRLGDATNAVCEGELEQNHLRYDQALTEAHYFDIIRRKTGSLTAVSCELGAYYAEADPQVVRAMHTFGMAAGAAFQIVDDILDITGDHDEVGKTLDRDLALGKLTLPTIHCLANAKTEIKRRLRDALTGKAPWDRHEVCHWLASTDSVDYAESIASQYVAEALAQLELLPQSDARCSLTAMAEFIVSRNF